jgi:tripeptide aminopeptidase
MNLTRARAAYTIDVSTVGEIEAETFGALEAKVDLRGISVHPGAAKGRMVNAVKMVADFIASLPRDGERRRRPRVARAS